MSTPVTIEYQGTTVYMVPVSYASNVANKQGLEAGCCAFCPFGAVDDRTGNHRCTARDSVRLNALNCDLHEDRFDDAVKGVWVPQQMYIEWLLERDSHEDT